MTKRFSVEKLIAHNQVILSSESGEAVTANADDFSCQPQKGMVFVLSDDGRYTRCEDAEKELKAEANKLLKTLVGGANGGLKKR